MHKAPAPRVGLEMLLERAPQEVLRLRRCALWRVVGDHSLLRARHEARVSLRIIYLQRGSADDA